MGFGASTPRMPVSISKLDRKDSLRITKHWPENNPYRQISQMHLVKSEVVFCFLKIKQFKALKAAWRASTLVTGAEGKRLESQKSNSAKITFNKCATPGGEPWASTPIIMVIVSTWLGFLSAVRMPHLLFLFHLLSLPPNSQSLCFGPDQLQYHATFEVKTNPALLRLCNVTVPPEKHIVNVVKIIIKMMRRMTWVSIHEWPKSNVKSGVLLFFLEGGGDLYNVDNGSTEKPSCQRTILHMLEACKDS